MVSLQLREEVNYMGTIEITILLFIAGSFMGMSLKLVIKLIEMKTQEK